MLKKFTPFISLTKLNKMAETACPQKCVFKSNGENVLKNYKNGSKFI